MIDKLSTTTGLFYSMIVQDDSSQGSTLHDPRRVGYRVSFDFGHLSSCSEVAIGMKMGRVGEGGRGGPAQDAPGVEVACAHQLLLSPCLPVHRPPCVVLLLGGLQ